MGDFPFGPNPALALQAATPAAGHALVNSTGAIITWTAPSDGKQHRVLLFAALDVTVNAVGGQIAGSLTLPDGTGQLNSMFAGNLTAGQYAPNTAGYPWTMALIEAGTTYTVEQFTALTGGTSTLFAEIWGS